MTHRSRFLSTVLLALALAACTPPANARPSPSANPSTAPSASAAPSESPSTEPSQGGACPVVEQTGALPSDRVTNIKIETTPTADLVTFMFGDKSDAPLSPI